MDVNRILRPESRILDIGAPGPELAEALAARGYVHYLGLVPDAGLPSARARADGIADRFHALTSSNQAFKSSADLLVLRGGFRRLLWSLRDLRHVEYVAVEMGPGRPPIDLVLARAMGRATRKLTPLGALGVGGSTFEVHAVKTVRPDRPRQYLSEVVGVAGLIDRLNDEGVRYAALRWFDSLPHLEPGEDLDLLVADDDLAAVRALLAEEPGTIAVDLYSETGLPGSDFQGAAYYVPDLARQILSGAIAHASGALVPSPRDHLLSLAYHAVYHKGERSGLPSDDAPAGFRDPDHDYAETLRRLAAAVGTTLPGQLEGIDEHLGREGWRPPPDALRRLGEFNPWIARRLEAQVQPPVEPPELSVFLVRERALTVVGIEDITAALAETGFEVILERQLDDEARQRCADVTRGGNWGSGPFPVSGGGPATALVAVHYGPEAPDPALHAQYPRLTNGDVLLAKQRIRDLIGALVDPEQRFNPLHSSDNEPEAWEYVGAAVPEAAVDLRAEVAARRDAYRTELPVLEVLSLARRAKVEVVDSAQGPAVRKTFAPQARRFMEREVRALRELGPLVDAVPELIDVGPNWVMTARYDNALGSLDELRPAGLLPLDVVREMVAVLRTIHELGFDLIDAKPQNFLLDPRRGLKIVDFEFFYSYPLTPPPFAEAYWLRGVPDDFVGDVPRGRLSYEWRWRRLTGLSRDGLLADSRWRQHLERAIYRTRHATIGPHGRPRLLARAGRSGLRRTRGLLASRYWLWARGRARAGEE
ncbi:hypothetical protein [Pengzhenrongella frigida]|uniref:Protein kinase domain-containing protein n=1 Tax=Pengzhenrongella frigida TaxID=1259133 RepID=A0A4Q5MUZ3_9MICO|nr:hypothetical protein [Cellulomonas sp. HLT2-17]RYV49392.1 hypothetical protein EUA98_19050 [Cellulomonas sp. HLT2-17]